MSRPDSIKTMGLRVYLEKTRADHDDHGYDDFVEMADKSVSVSAMCRLFGVSRFTMNKWLALYEAEK